MDPTQDPIFEHWKWCVLPALKLDRHTDKSELPPGNLISSTMMNSFSILGLNGEFGKIYLVTPVTMWFSNWQNKEREILTCRHVLYVQEVVTHFYIVSYYIKWINTSWTHSMYAPCAPLATKICNNFWLILILFMYVWRHQRNKMYICWTLKTHVFFCQNHCLFGVVYRINVHIKLLIKYKKEVS